MRWQRMVEAVACACVPWVRLSFAPTPGDVVVGMEHCWGTVLTNHRSFTAVLLSHPAEQLTFTSVHPDRLADLIAQGRAGAIAGVLGFARPRGRWFWFPWRLLPRQSQHRWIPLDDPDVLDVGDADHIFVTRILQQRVTADDDHGGLQ